MNFRIGDQWFTLSFATLALARGLYTRAKVKTPNFDDYLTTYVCGPDETFFVEEVWAILGRGQYRKSDTKVNKFLQLEHRVLHRMVVNSVALQTSSHKKINNYD